MAIFDLFGYAGAGLVGVYIIIRLIPSFIIKKKEPILIDMIVWLVSLVCLFIYSISIRNYSFIIFFAGAILWDAIWLTRHKF